jgi:pre-mycofactocin synthase
MGSAWFETVAEAERRARKRLPPSVYGALLAGTEKGLTLADNVAAFDVLGFVPQVAGLAAQWGGPVMLKGVSRVDDARRAADAGLTAISVSNHGGNNLDGTPAAIRLLAAIATAVGGQVEVLLDGGIRRGGDVVKALALGARAVMIGRAYLWGLAANGQAGVENVLDILRSGIDSALLGLGRSSAGELTAADVVIPPGFTRTLGAGPGPAGWPA